MASMDLRSEHRQSQNLSPRLQHAVRLLQMSSLDFAATVRDSLGTNPFLESEEADDSEVLARSDAPGPNTQSTTDPRLADAFDDASPAAPDGDTERLRDDEGEREFDSATDGDRGGESERIGEDDRDLWQADAGTGQRPTGEGELSALDSMAMEPTLAMHLCSQLRLLRLPHREALLAQAVIESLDDDGYLRTALGELIEVTALEPAATTDELARALARVQTLEPAGVAARSVGECLLLQMSEIGCGAQRALAQTIVNDHLETLAARDLQGLARRLGRPVAEVEAVCDRIRHLDPRPGWRFGASAIAYVVPDVLVRKVRGLWTVTLNPAVVPRVRLNQVYAQLFQRHRSAQNAAMAGHLQEAKWTVKNVEQRFSTILDVAEAIVRRQKYFFEYGAMAMKPLGLKEIAEEVGIHESTVSRVTNNKYMATPVGVFELKHFFSRAMVSANGSACSGTAIRSLIKDMIESESPDGPISDAEITRQLCQQGLVVARRTVTKYRQMLKIEAVDRRRRHAA